MTRYIDVTDMQQMVLQHSAARMMAEMADFKTYNQIDAFFTARPATEEPPKIEEANEFKTELVTDNPRFKEVVSILKDREVFLKQIF